MEKGEGNAEGVRGAEAGAANKAGFASREEYHAGEYSARGYTSAGNDAAEYEAQGYEPAGYDAAEYEAQGYEPAGNDAAEYKAQGYEPAGYGVDEYQPPSYEPSAYEAGEYQSLGYVPPSSQSAPHQPVHHPSEPSKHHFEPDLAPATSASQPTSLDSEQPSHEQSFYLFQQGKTVREVAKERNLKPVTIENHIIRCLSEGHTIEWHRVIPPEFEAVIMAKIQEIGAEKLKPLKDELPEGVDYLAIKAAILKYQEEHLLSK
ncbi:helix-turn-helix domain-containing protein [Brevibacillus dissolubilis]|uniref:helix-turn-helix domain-containing protein n=1 Tax=Brevibacillus dissolubilis TaxID=1844116 RepID=UPI0021006559|nr:helix-turn-helix domain-containing protein [Brevibacillus dissolubilis]